MPTLDEFATHLGNKELAIIVATIGLILWIHEGHRVTTLWKRWRSS